MKLFEADQENCQLAVCSFNQSADLIFQAAPVGQQRHRIMKRQRGRLLFGCKPAKALVVLIRDPTKSEDCRRNSEEKHNNREFFELSLAQGEPGVQLGIG